ncbi:hypothetical protein B0H12DRAFT_1225993 [Mycena haematopus]|nr:hypothetical protein B0H12DRAFT_1225993 [Mycena haematopus]
MSSTSSSNSGASRPSQKGGGAPQNQPEALASARPGPQPYQGSNPQVVINYNTSISGGQGGSGGEGGVDGGSGGTGKGSIVHQHFPSPPVVQASQVLNHCSPPSRIFHGRRTILDVMHQFFAQDTQKQKIYVLYGLGGAGKTQIALKFIEEWTGFTDRLLVDASTTETIGTGLQNIATAKNSGNSLQDALNWLRNNQDNWLLFFDNADDPAINLNQILPKCNHGNIIITSRNPNLRVYGAHSHVSDMEELDAVALLLKSANQDMSPSTKLLALEIVKALWYLPLAIVQAGAFISESGTLNTYLDLFAKNYTELLKTRPTQTHDDYKSAVYTTWEMSFSKLSPPAAIFLQLCSFLHRDDIFEEIFSRAANYAMKLPDQPQSKPKRLQKLKSKFNRVFSSGSSQSKSSSENEMTKAREFLSHFLGPTREWDPLQYLKLTNEIKAYSLINYDVEKKSFSIHPLVHSWSQTTLADQQSYHLCMCDILGMSISEIPGQNKQLASLRLVSHVDSLKQIIPKLTTNFLLDYANVYYYVGPHTNAAELEFTVFEQQRKLLGDVHLDTLVAMNNLASTYNSLGQFEEAEKLQVVVLEKRRKLLGDDHLDTLTSMHNLAFTYNHLGRFEEAEKLQVVVLEKQRKLVGNDHLDTLITMHNLAFTYDDLSRFEEAEKLYVEVLEKRRKLLSNDHLDTLTSMHNLAFTYDNLGRLEEAEKLYVVVLEKRRKLLGDDHLDTLLSMYSLAFTYDNLGRFEEAEKLYVVVLEKQRKLLGDDHLDTLLSMHELAFTYDNLGRLEEAEKLYGVVLEKQRELLGDDHLDTLTSMHNLAFTYNNLCRFEEAEKLYVMVLEKERKLLGDDHLGTQLWINKQRQQNLNSSFTEKGGVGGSAQVLVATHLGLQRP